MNNLSSYCGLDDRKIRASDKYLPVRSMFSTLYHSGIFFRVFDFVCTIRIDLTSRKMAKILLNFPFCVSAKREKCSIRHGAKIYRWHYWGIYQAIQQESF
jgi:hypothetical protein